MRFNLSMCRHPDPSVTARPSPPARPAVPVSALHALVWLALALYSSGPRAAPVDNQGRQVWAASAPRGGSDELLTEAFKALEQGLLPKAATAFGAALKKDPNNVAALLGMAEVESKSGRRAEAESLLHRASKLAPENPEVLVSQARFFHGGGQYDKALTWYRKALTKRPGDESLHRSVGDLYLNGLKKPEDAIAAYQRAIELAPTAVAPRFGLAFAQLAAGRKPAAMAQLEEIERLAPQSPEAPHLLGRILASEKRFEPAVTAMDRALKIRPDFMPAINDRADIHTELRQDALAAAGYEQMLKLTPDNSTARLKLAMTYHRMDRLDEAYTAYLAAIERNQSLAVAYNNLAMITLKRKGDAKQAVNWATKAVALTPQVPQFHDTLGWSYRASGDLARASTSLENAVRLGGAEQPELSFRLGMVYEELGRKADARAAYQRSLATKTAFSQQAEARSRLAALSP